MEIVAQHFNYFLYACMHVWAPLTAIPLYTDNLAANRNNLVINEFPTDDNGQLTLFFGETAHLNCSGLATRSLTGYFWRSDNGTLVCPLRENPFCVPRNQTFCGIPIPNGGCRVDTINGPRCNRSRVYSYIYSSVENCTYGIQRRHAMMVINGVTWSDAGIYTCTPSVEEEKNKTMNVTIG